MSKYGKYGGGVNIYAQKNEPPKKDGIWINTKKTLTNDISYVELVDMPYNFSSGSSVTIENDIYLVKDNVLYKYNTLISEYTQLANIPFTPNAAVSIGTYIYLFGRYTAYRYDTLTDTYTKLTDIPYDLYSSAVTSVGTDIYLFGGNPNYYGKYAYKYNTLTGEYSKLNDIPYLFENGLAVSIEDDVYLFGAKGTTYHTEAYRYSTKANTYTRLADIPYEFFDGSIVTIDDDIYLFGNASNSSATAKLRKYAYRYNTKSNSYTRLIDMPYDFTAGLTESIGDEIYLFGGNSSVTIAYKCLFKVLPEILKYKYNKVKLISSLTIESDVLTNKNIYIQITQTNAKIYDDNELKDYPAYYGDGEKWNLIA